MKLFCILLLCLGFVANLHCSESEDQFALIDNSKTAVKNNIQINQGSALVLLEETVHKSSFEIKLQPGGILGLVLDENISAPWSEANWPSETCVDRLRGGCLRISIAQDIKSALQKMCGLFVNMPKRWGFIMQDKSTPVVLQYNKKDNNPTITVENGGACICLGTEIEKLDGELYNTLEEFCMGILSEVWSDI